MSTEPSISNTDKEFSRIRAMLWPIHKYELKKLLPMLIMFACIAFSYSALRSSKDSGIMETEKGTLSASAIPLLKVLLVLPAAFLAKSIYGALRQRFSEQKTFYILISAFMIFFPIFAFVFHPKFETHRVQLKAAKNASKETTVQVSSKSTISSTSVTLEVKDSSAQHAAESTPAADTSTTKAPSTEAGGFWAGVKKLGNDLRYALTTNLDNTAFYVMSELWGSVALSLLFWGFANSVCKVSETSRFYPLLGFGANSATFAFGWVSPLIQKSFTWSTGLDYALKKTHYDLFFLKTLSVLVFGCGLVTLACYYYLQTYVLTDPQFFTPVKNVKKRPKSQGLIAGLRYIFQDPYLRNICFSVVAYGVLSQMIEYISKEQVNLHYRALREQEGLLTGEELTKALKADVNNFNALMTSLSGGVAAFMGLIGAGNIIRHMGWTFSALVTPIIMLLTGSLALGNATFPKFVEKFFLPAGMKSYTLGTWLHGIQITTSKGTKYTLFDSTKEMAYVPLDADTKNRAKAEIDLVGSRFGKAGGSLYNFTLLAALGGNSPLIIAPVSLVALLAFGSYWCVATGHLGMQFKGKLAMRNREDSMRFKRAE